MYVDSHQHFWKLSRGDYSWMTPDMKVLYKDFFPEDLEPLIKQKNITKTVIVQAADTVAETEFTLSLASKYEFIACLLYTSPSPRDRTRSRMPSSA